MALRTVLAALWAAAWVRGRLLAAAARRLAGGRGTGATSTSPGYYLAQAETPVEGVDYEVGDLPPQLVERLDAARIELVDRARGAAERSRRARRARRRRGVSVALAAVLGLAVVGAGASALVRGSTGVPAVDRLLGIYERTFEKPGARDVRDARGRLPRRVGESATIAIPARGDAPRIVSTAYLAQNGDICVALVVKGEGGGGASCVAAGFVGGRIARGKGVVLGVLGSRGRVVLSGLVDDDATELEASGPRGTLETFTGSPWAPGVGGIGSVRPFVAVGAPAGGDVTMRDYRIRARFSDGRVVEFPR